MPVIGRKAKYSRYTKVLFHFRYVRSFIRWLFCSFVYTFIVMFVCLHVYFVYTFIVMFVCLHVYFVYTFIVMFVCLHVYFVYTFIVMFVCLHVYCFVHSLTHLLFSSICHQHIPYNILRLFKIENSFVCTV